MSQNNFIQQQFNETFGSIASLNYLEDCEASFTYDDNRYVIRGSSVHGDKEFFNKCKEQYGREIIPIIAWCRKVMREIYGANYCYEFNRLFGDVAILTDLSKFGCTFILRGEVFTMDNEFPFPGKNKHPQFRSIVSWCKAMMIIEENKKFDEESNQERDDFPEGNIKEEFEDQFENIRFVKAHDFGYELKYDEQFLVHVDEIYNLEYDSNRLLFTNHFDELLAAVTWCYNKIEQKCFKNSISCDEGGEIENNSESNPETVADSEIEENEGESLHELDDWQSYRNMIKTVNEHNEIRQQKKRERFMEQNFRINSLIDFKYAEIWNSFEKSTDVYLTVEVSFGMEPIAISLKCRNCRIVESLNDTVKIIRMPDVNKCDFKSLEHSVPVSHLSEFEEIFRWCLREVESFVSYELYFIEEFSISNEVYTERTRNALSKKFGIDNAKCNVNSGGDYCVNFEVDFGGPSPYYFEFSTSSIVSGCGFMKSGKSKIVQATDIDDFIPMKHRKLAIEIIKFCAILVNYRGELEIEEERETTEMEKQMREEDVCFVDGNYVFFYDEDKDDYFTYNMLTKPTNEREKRIVKIWKSFQ